MKVHEEFKSIIAGDTNLEVINDAFTLAFKRAELAVVESEHERIERERQEQTLKASRCV